MLCPYCNKEMEKGRILASGAGSIPIAILEWYAEKEFEKKGVIAAIKRKSVKIVDSKDGYYRESYYCDRCDKVFGEFPTKKKKKT